MQSHSHSDFNWKKKKCIRHVLWPRQMPIIYYKCHYLLLLFSDVFIGRSMCATTFDSWSSLYCVCESCLHCEFLREYLRTSTGFSSAVNVAIAVNIYRKACFTSIWWNAQLLFNLHSTKFNVTLMHTHIKRGERESKRIVNIYYGDV